jgi:hypothetical protein
MNASILDLERDALASGAPSGVGDVEEDRLIELSSQDRIEVGGEPMNYLALLVVPIVGLN